MNVIFCSEIIKPLSSMFDKDKAPFSYLTRINTGNAYNE